MPRPSLKAERTGEILDAYERCIAAHGVEGATLERVADEAGLARALIRHNIGNKDQLLEAFLDRFIERSSRDGDEFFRALPDEDRITVMIDWLFEAGYSDQQRVNVTNALLIAAAGDAALAKRLRSWTQDFVVRVQFELERAHPDQAGDKIQAVATGIAAIYFNYDSLEPLGGGDELRESSRAAARLLIGTLEQAG